MNRKQIASIGVQIESTPGLGSKRFKGPGASLVDRNEDDRTLRPSHEPRVTATTRGREGANRGEGVDETTNAQVESIQKRFLASQNALKGDPFIPVQIWRLRVWLLNCPRDTVETLVVGREFIDGSHQCLLVPKVGPGVGDRRPHNPPHVSEVSEALLVDLTRLGRPEGCAHGECLGPNRVTRWNHDQPPCPSLLHLLGKAVVVRHHTQHGPRRGLLASLGRCLVQ